MQRRRTTERPIIIARSTFPTSIAGHWLGDDTATWDAYMMSIGEQLALFQFTTSQQSEPMSVVTVWKQQKSSAHGEQN